MRPDIAISVSVSDVKGVGHSKYLSVTLSSNFTWTEHVSTKINELLGLLRRIKSLLPRSALFFSMTVSFSRSLIMPTLFGGGGGERGNALLMNNLQLLQNKAAKTILDRPFYSSATDTLEALSWLTLMKRRSFHRCLYYSITFINIYVNEISAHSMDLLTNKDVLGYDTLATQR